ATLQTASTPDFYSRIQDPSSLLIVIDESHRAGSERYRRIFSIDAPARLGLSATPNRFNDPDGTQAIYGYFERTLVPRFTLRDAIQARRLCPYTYYVHGVQLSEDEQVEWDRLTREIAVEVARTVNPTDGFP